MLKKLTYLLIAFIFIFGNFIDTSAQNKPSPEVSKKEENSEQAKVKELERLEKENFAVSLIDSLAADAGKYKDRVASVRIQAKTADIIWERDQERAKAIFLKAWSLAEKVEKEEQEAIAEKRKKAVSEKGNGLTFIPPPPNLRREILELVGRRDGKFTEELLARFQDEKEEEIENADKKETYDPTDASQAVKQRLGLAAFLIRNGEVEKALAIADPALQRVSVEAIGFLTALREKLPSAADLRYSQLLAKSAVDPFSDATSVSLLSSYVFSPNTIVMLTQNGMMTMRSGEQSDASQIPEKLKSDFMQVAAQILLRPLPILAQDNTSAGRGGLYFTITRLLPLFETYLPDRVPALQSQLNAVLQDVEESRRDQAEKYARTGLGEDDPQKQELKDILSELKSASDDKKDILYAQAARLAASNNDLKARDYAEKISDSDLKKRVLAFVDFILIKKAIDEKKVDSALESLEKANLPALQQIWLTTEVARLLGKKREFEARRLLEKTLTEAEKTDNKTAWKANALSAIAQAFLEFDELRSWQIASKVVKAANTADFYDDNKSKLSIILSTGNSTSIITPNSESLNISKLFAKLAPLDIYQAADLAGNLTDENLRALSIIAAAKSQMEKKNTKK